MEFAAKQLRERLRNQIDQISDPAVKEAAEEWKATYTDGTANAKATEKLVAALEACKCDCCKEILEYKDFLSKKSVWIFAETAGHMILVTGGLDHVLASGEDVNVMYSIRKYIRIPVVRLPSPLRLVLLHSSLRAVSRLRKRIWLEMAMSYWLCLCCTGCNGL